jgi:hypothetical protein
MLCIGFGGLTVRLHVCYRAADIQANLQTLVDAKLLFNRIDP